MAVHAGRALFEQGIGDRRGNAQRGVLVYVYEAGTSTLATLYTDRTKATEQDNPLSTNGLGNLAIFADPGDYEAHVDSTGAELHFTVLPDWEDVVTGDEPEGGLPAHLADAVDAHDASAVSFTPAAGVAATDVQAAIVEVAGDVASDVAGLAAHLADASDSHDASAVSFVPAGGIAATTVQAALVELDSDKEPTIPPGTYVQVDRARLNPKDAPFNAVGGGAGDDTVAVNNCLVAAAADGRGVYIDDVFAGSQFVVPSGSDIDGPGELRKTATSPTNTALVLLSDVTDVVIDGITVDCANLITPYSSGTVTQRHGVMILGACVNIELGSKMRVKNAGRDGVYVGDGAGFLASPRDVRIYCQISAITRNGVSVVSGDGVVIDKASVSDCGLINIDIEPNANTPFCREVTVSGCTLVARAGVKSAILAANKGVGSAGIYGRVRFINNDVTGAPGNDVSTVRLQEFPDSLVSGNTIRGACANGINVAQSPRATVTGNRVVESGPLDVELSQSIAGILISQSPDSVVVANSVKGSYWNGILISRSDSTVVVANQVRDVGQWHTVNPAYFAWSGIYVLDSIDCVVTANRVLDSQATKTMSHGIRTRESAATCTGNMIFGNKVGGALVTDYATASAHLAPVRLAGAEIADGLDIAIGTTTGTRIGQANSKIAFAGGTPLPLPLSDISPSVNKTVDVTYGAEEAAVLGNLRIQVDQIASKLRSVNLLTTRSAFDPLSVPDLAWGFWGDDLTGSEGSQIDTWLDISANARHLAQGSESLRPTVRHGISQFGGLTVARFDGADDDIQATGFTIAQPITVFQVYRRTSASSGTRTQVGSAIPASTPNRVLLRQSGTAHNQFAGITRSGGTVSTTATIRHDVINGVASTLHVAGVPILTAGDAGSESMAGVSIGGGNFLGDIYAMFCWSRALSVAEQNTIGAALASKCGLAWTTVV